MNRYKCINVYMYMIVYIMFTTPMYILVDCI